MRNDKFETKLWTQYYLNREKFKQPSPLLEVAIRHLPRHGTKCALDLGSGNGNDSLFLLKQGFCVHAFDAQRAAIARLKRVTPKRFKSHLKTRVIRFEDIRRPDLPELSIVNASLSIFYSRRSSFGQLWRNLSYKLHTGGIFCGQFIGPHDSWAPKVGMTALARNELLRILNESQIIELTENENDSGMLAGNAKHWHIFHVIACKR
ncbi:MAG: hypothetical protein K1X79_08615 [Oligoflexia bacterium]|nr:hypothetical protein [Oligoflexia bacterium]